MKKIQISVKTLLVATAFFGASSIATAQNVGINASGATPDASAALDVSASDKGMLVPRVALTATTDVATITTPATSLLVYNTATAADVTPGYYYFDGTIWQRMVSGTIVGTDDQNITGSGLAGTTLTIGIEGGTNETVDLSSLQDGTGTDSQTLSLSGSTLSISGGNNVTLADNVNDADADATNELQTISKTGTTVTLSNGGGSFTDVDTDTQLTEVQVDAFANNNGYLTSFTEVDGSTTNELNTAASLSGTTLSVTDAGGSQTVDLAPLKDHDWYEVGGTTQPDAITDNIFTQGNVGIGTVSPSNSLHISSVGLPALKVEDSQTTPGGFPRLVLVDRGANLNEKVWDFRGSDNGNLYIGSLNDAETVFYRKMSIEQSGNVGIGLAGANPATEKLDVRGSVKIVDGTQGAGKVLTSDANGKASWINLPGSTSVVGTFSNAINTNIPATPWWNMGSINLPSAGVWLISINARLVHPATTSGQNAWHMAFVNSNLAPSSTNLLSLESVMGVVSTSSDYGDLSRHVSVTVNGPTTIYCKANTGTVTQVHDLGVSYGYGVNANYFYARKLSN